MTTPSFTDRLLVLFGSPNSSDDELLMKEYQRLLKSYPTDIIDAAVDRLARAHKFAGWPKIAECVAAAEDEIEARAWKVRAENGGERPQSDPAAAARLMARRFVNGARANGWEWSLEFRGHPWVALAESEGWGSDLRGACIHRAAFLFGDPKRSGAVTPESVMPDAGLVSYWRDGARRSREAAAWREANPNHRSIRGLTPIDVSGLLANAKRRQAVDPSTGEVYEHG
jgi:hypothetical protein